MIFGTSSVLSGLMRSSGTVLWPTLLSIVSIWGVEVPVAYALAPQLGLRGVWIAYPVAFAASLRAADDLLPRVLAAAKAHRAASRATRPSR